MNRTIIMLTLSAVVSVFSVQPHAKAQLIEKKALTLEAAKKVAAAAEAQAKAKGARVVIAVVDEGGNLLVLERLDDTQVASVEVGIGKARTAAIFRRPSKEFEEQIKGREGARPTGKEPVSAGSGREGEITPWGGRV